MEITSFIVVIVLYFCMYVSHELYANFKARKRPALAFLAMFATCLAVGVGMAGYGAVAYESRLQERLEAVVYEQ
jgi:hypothetical protein